MGVCVGGGSEVGVGSGVAVGAMRSDGILQDVRMSANEKIKKAYDFIFCPPHDCDLKMPIRVYLALISHLVVL
jgi:hypothetical protein